MNENAGETAPLIHKKFFQCCREQSCTHVIQHFNEQHITHGSEELGKRKHGAVRINEKVKIKNIHFSISNIFRAFKDQL